MMIKNIYKRESIYTLVGVDCDHFKPRLNKRLKKFKYIIHSTDYSPMKRTDLALLSFAKVVKKFPNIKLIITSTQPDSEQRKIYIKLATKLKVIDNVIFKGFIPYNDLPKYYSNALCYLSCSYNEMLGTTISNLPVKEAMSCGVPAIRHPIFNEDVEDGVSGFLVDPRDTDIVAEKIIWLIENPKERIKMGLDGRKKVMELYQWDKVSDRIIEEIDNF